MGQFIIVFQVLVPIALYVSLEGVKLILSYLIAKDECLISQRSSSHAHDIQNSCATAASTTVICEGAEGDTEVIYPSCHSVGNSILVVAAMSSCEKNMRRA